jgi:hypothetical protein
MSELTPEDRFEQFRKYIHEPTEEGKQSNVQRYLTRFFMLASQEEYTRVTKIISTEFHKGSISFCELYCVPGKRSTSLPNNEHISISNHSIYVKDAGRYGELICIPIQMKEEITKEIELEGFTIYPKENI